MKRLVIVFMLMWLPLQLTWAAVGNYAMHESSNASLSQTQEEHSHNALNDNQADSKNPSNVDHDCTTYHFHFQLVMSMPELFTGIPDVNIPSSQLVENNDSMTGGRPERPQWKSFV